MRILTVLLEDFIFPCNFTSVSSPTVFSAAFHIWSGLVFNQDVASSRGRRLRLSTPEATEQHKHIDDNVDSYKNVGSDEIKSAIRTQFAPGNPAFVLDFFPIRANE